MLMYENDEIQLTGVGLADLDLILDPNNPLNAELKRAPPSFSTDYIGMNVNEPPFDDPKVRQALNYAIDKQAISRDVLADLVMPRNRNTATGVSGLQRQPVRLFLRPGEGTAAPERIEIWGRSGKLPSHHPHHGR